MCEKIERFTSFIMIFNVLEYFLMDKCCIMLHIFDTQSNMIFFPIRLLFILSLFSKIIFNPNHIFDILSFKNNSNKTIEDIYYNTNVVL